MFVRQSKDSYQLTERRPASCFEEAYPIGNGFQGAMVYGGVEKEKISLNDDTLWTGYPRDDRYTGDGKAALERAKTDILNGDYVSAHRELTQNFACYASQSYLPLGELVIDRTGDLGKLSGYSLCGYELFKGTSVNPLHDNAAADGRMADLCEILAKSGVSERETDVKVFCEQLFIKRVAAEFLFEGLVDEESSVFADTIQLIEPVL